MIIVKNIAHHSTAMVIDELESWTWAPMGGEENFFLKFIKKETPTNLYAPINWSRRLAVPRRRTSAKQLSEHCFLVGI